MRTLTIKCEAEGSRSSSPHGSREGEGGRTQARVGSSNSGGNGNGSSRFTFNEHNGDMSYGPFFDNEKLRISTAVGPDLRSLRPGEEEG